MENETYILLFDGECKLCSGLVQFVMKYDKSGKIKFAPLQSPRGKALLMKKPELSGHIDSVVFIRGKEYYVRSQAIFNILDVVGGAWKAFHVLNFLPDFFLDKCYDLVAGSRYRIFGKRNQCPLPSADIPENF